jgi:hypothetical protein
LKNLYFKTALQELKLMLLRLAASLVNSVKIFLPNKFPEQK